MFQSVSFAIENRPGLEDQGLERVMSILRRLDAPSLVPDGQESIKKAEVAKWLSDWHLLSFLETTQLFSVVSGFFLSLIHGTGIDRFCSRLGGYKTARANRILS